MFNISSFLNKFQKNVADAEDLKMQIINIIKNKTEINTSLENLEIKNNIIYIQASPAVKNKLFMFKEGILEDIQTISSIKIIDIR